MRSKTKSNLSWEAIKRDATSELLERDDDGTPIYMHSEHCPNYCDYACNSRLGELIAIDIETLEKAKAFPMTSPATRNVKEAAERLRPHRHELGIASIADRDALTLAMLDLLDDAAITPAALEACGYTYEGAVWRFDIGSKIDIEVVYTSGVCRVYVQQDNDVVIVPITTIGALRMLIAALSQKDTVTQPNPASDEEE